MPTYKSQPKSSKLLKRETVIIVGLMLCQGKPLDKACTLLDLLMPPEKYPTASKIALNNPNFDIIICQMIEFALIYAELFSYEISPQSSQYEIATNDRIKIRAARAMLVSEIKHDDKIGFLHSLFKDDVEVTFD